MTATREIYLDNAATTRPWPEVVGAVTEAMSNGFGNPSSRHRRGLAAAREVLRAEESIRAFVGNGAWKVVFTSGGTEADTLAIAGSVPRGKRDTIVMSQLEHAAVAETAKAVAVRGGRAVSVSGGVDGVVGPKDIETSLDGRCALVSLCHVAAELGTVQPVGRVAQLVKDAVPRCRVHVDAVQAAAQLSELDLPDAVDMVSLSAHKIHGPPGIGALLLRPNVTPRPMVFGGDQQDGIRPGTLNLPGIVGFGLAARLYRERRIEGVKKMKTLRDRLVAGIASAVTGARPLGRADARAPGMVVLAVDGVKSEVLLHALEMRGLLASSSSACHATRTEPPESLVAAGLKAREGAVRLSLSLDTEATEIEDAIGIFQEAVRAVKSGRAGDL